MIRLSIWLALFIFFLLLSVSLLNQESFHVSEHEHKPSSIGKIFEGEGMTELEILGRDTSGKIVKTRFFLEENVWHMDTVHDELIFIPTRLQKKVDLMRNAQIDRCFAVQTHQFLQYGLEVPVVTLQVTVLGSRQSVDFGFQTPDGFGRYIRVEGRGDVCTVPRYHYENLVDLGRLGSEFSESDHSL